MSELTPTKIIANEKVFNNKSAAAVTLKNLDAATIELKGKHLIEASAGTGKTYNITRIYLRLLLERELTVEQILLMTFTKAATQELRARIDAFIHLALHDWHRLCQEDSYFTALEQRLEKELRIGKEQREFLLKRALLFLDEAAIFTIHGFCQRVLNQYAFTSGLPFNANMAANSTEITLQVCQDWYRSLAKADGDSFMLLASFWPTPDSFLSSFSKAIGHTSSLSVVDVEAIESEFISLVRQASKTLSAHSELFENALILVKKGAEQDKRRSELKQLITWLESIISKELSLIDVGQGIVKMADGFFDGKRYARSSFKAELLTAFAPVKLVKEQVKKIANNINKAKAYTIVKSGIYTIRQQVIEQKKALNILDFDDLINTLVNCLNPANATNDGTSDDLSDGRASSASATILAKQLLAQYPVALVDEFQDTDPKQFGILQAIYYGENAVRANAGLFLIGDPKQAIYGFRGGDIFAYLNARSGCDYHWLMDTNWRSTAEMIAGYNQLFTYKRNESLADEMPNQATESVFGFGIPYLPVLAGKKSAAQELAVEKPTASSQLCPTNSDNSTKNRGDNSNDDSDKALQFIYFSDPSQENEKVNQGARPLLANWCADEIVSLLTSNEQATQSAASSTTASNTKVQPKDIAILVRDGAEARDIKQALQKAGLESVFLSDRANLFHSQQAKQLLCLLKGVLLAENERLFIAALCCGLLGYDAEKLQKLQQDEMAYQTLKFAFIDYRTQWQRQGFITMAINLMHNLFDLTQDNKDRCLTNILHLFEILQAASIRLSQGQELVHWFEQQCLSENNDVEAELRLESDGDLIRLITQHGCKGLEYPYVFIPFACRHKDPLKFGNKAISYLEYHDQQGQLCLSLDGSKQAKQAMSDEAYAESIRLLYVAITRAERRCYVLCCAFDGYHLSPLGKILQLTENDNIIKPLQALKDSAADAIGLRQVSLESTIDATSHTAIEDQSAVEGLANKRHCVANTVVSRFTGNIERDWWLSSFTALSRNMRHVGVSNPDRDADLASVPSEELMSTEKICFKLVKGAHTGNLLHDILQHTDFTAPNWPESLEQPLLNYSEFKSAELKGNELEGGEFKTSQLRKNDNSAFTTDDLIEWLEQVINSPFISSDNTDELACLADIDSNKSLRESEFYFPMQGQGTGALAKLLTDHRYCAQRNNSHNTSQPKALKYPVMLPSYKKLSGMMHGFIDLIFEYQGKYYLCDYKSSHLGDRYQDYQFDALLDNVEKNYYDLQYLIYSLALHRYLKQNLSDYRLSEHFGGVYYLYLRGMTTDPEHKGAGVYYRKITEPEINNLDALFSAESAEQIVNKEGT